MPITVKHDTGSGDLSGLVGLAALVGSLQHKAPQAPTVTPMGLPRISGGGGGSRGGGGMSSRDQFAMQAEKLKSARNQQMMQIDAQADRQKQSADDAMKRVAMEAGLDEEMRGQEYDMEVKKMQEAAKVDANKLEYRIGAEGRQELAKINRGRSAVAKALANGTITESDSAAMNRDLDRQAAGVEPDAMPADPNRIDGVGQMQTGDSGFTYTIGPDGTPKLMQRWDQGPEAAKIKAQEAALQVEQTATSKREEKLLDIRMKLATESIVTGTGENKSVRNRTSEEVDGLMRTIFGLAQPAEQPVQEERWWEKDSTKGMDIEEGDKEYPQMVGHAKAYVRTWGKNGPSKVPEDKKEAYFEAINILRQYSSQTQAQ